jgi:hypothetical protein
MYDGGSFKIPVMLHHVHDDAEAHRDLKASHVFPKNFDASWANHKMILVHWDQDVWPMDTEASMLFQRVRRWIDYCLEPESADTAVANLEELYLRRLAVDPGHAKWWLFVQFAWLVFGRAIELLRTFSAARAGK